MLVEVTTLPPRREKKETVFWRTGNSLSLDVNDALLLLLSRFSRVRFYATPETPAHQAPPSLGFQTRTLEWVAIAFSNA